MKGRRRLTMQLTPLLDLLLIVIFAQFMDVREREATTVDEAKQAVELRFQAEAELADLQSTHERAVDALNQAAQLVAQLRSQNQELEQNSDQLQSEVERAVAQQRLLGELVSQLFHIPGDTIAEVLLPGRKTQLALSQKLSQNSCPLRDRHSRV